MGRSIERLCGPCAIRSLVPPRFAEALEASLRGIPPGRVATCGAVARSLGDVRAARAVAEWIRGDPEIRGAHRVVRADGQPVLPGAIRVLREEGTTDPAGHAAPERFLEELPEVPFLTTLRAEQVRLAARLRERDDRGQIDSYGGVDVSYSGDRAYAVAVTLDARTLETRESVVRELDVDFPYIPTYLAFREFPPVREAIESLAHPPDLLFVDGHGRLHPALFGFACYLGVRLDLRTVGIAKHPLAGSAVPGAAREGGPIPIRLRGRTRGYAWTPPGSGRSIYVSVGHRVSLETALTVATRATKERYPEPLRIADRLSKEERKKNEEGHSSERAANRRLPAHRHRGD